LLPEIFPLKKYLEIKSWRQSDERRLMKWKSIRAL
jgi:hypothetical protein